MSLKLRLAVRLAGEGTLLRFIDEVERRTLDALDGLLERLASDARAVPGRPAQTAKSTLAERRAAMTASQNARVGALVKALGRDEAVRAGREALFPVGVGLGREARQRLGVGDGPEDLERAARLLYRALGIDFTLERSPDGPMTMRVRRCALAARYSTEACEILSAADEGVVAGLSPGYSLRFEERMTAGPKECRARIREVR